jgi:hypothetical protein
MDAQEFELVLNDLETRVDRLRALYENWFRGYEKLEPQVARKDVERRVYGLRKELPRNTALRFRYHQLYQRYTTLANYWQRTGRQIEEGTHRFQLQRLKRRKGEERDPETRERRSDAPGPKSYELDLNENFSVNDLLSDFELDEVARAVDTPGPHSEPPPPLKPAPDLLSAPPRAVGVFKPRRASNRPSARPKPMSETRASSPPPSQLAAQQAAREQKKQAPQSPLEGGALPPPPATPRTSLPGVPPVLPPAPAAPMASGIKPAGSTPRAAPPVPGALPPRSPAQPSPSASGAKPAPAGAVPPVPRAPAPSTAGAAPRPAPMVASGALPPQDRRAPIQSGGTMVGRPPPPPGPPAGPAGAPNEQRLRRLYDEYTAARRKNNEGEVRYDALVTSIQKMLPELQKKHQGKQIDFEVVMKDGRVGLKPKAL